MAFVHTKRTLRHVTKPGLILLLVVCSVLSAFSENALAQDKGVPGKFDFYLLDMPWGPEFCSIKDVSPQCEPQRGFVLHGLWAQNYDGTWPVFCGNEAGPKDLAKNLDLTPDLQLLQHEWDKHGTCSAVGPKKFFAMEREAFRKVKMPAQLKRVDKEISMTSDHLLDLFAAANAGFTKESFSISCKDGGLTAIEACLDKNLHAIACKGLHPCEASTLKIAAPSVKQY
jgi:ribonuclease T2